MLALLLLCAPVILFWATYEQQGNTIALWADARTDRSIGLLGWTVDIPTTWFQAFNPLMIFAFTPFILALWARQSRRGREPSTLSKMALGCFGVTAANLILAIAAMQAGADKASWLWLFAYFIVITIGELYLSPIGLSLVSKMSPARAVSMMMGVWLATSFFGNLLAGVLGSYWSAMDKPRFLPDDRRHRSARGRRHRASAPAIRRPAAGLMRTTRQSAEFNRAAAPHSFPQAPLRPLSIPRCIRSR